MCGCCCLGLWRFVTSFDHWLIKYLKPYHQWVFDFVVRIILPGCPAPKPCCEFLTYFCLIMPIEEYRWATCREVTAGHRLMAEAACFLCKQLDIFDLDEITDAAGIMPDWKRYMIFRKWPWDDQTSEDEDEEDEDEEDEEDEEEEEEEEDSSYKHKKTKDGDKR